MTVPDHLLRMWPRVRVGQRVRLRGGKVVDLISVTRARNVLLQLAEVQASHLGIQCKSAYGEHWMEIYYEAQGRVPGTMATVKVRPNDIEAILGTS